MWYFCWTNLPLQMDWETIDSAETFQAAIDASNEKPVVLFKHSTRCSISRMALKTTTIEWDLPSSIRPYLIDLLAHREISRRIEEQLQIRHESPQILFVRNGVCVYHANHESIDARALKAYL